MVDRDLLRSRTVLSNHLLFQWILVRQASLLWKVVTLTWQNSLYVNRRWWRYLWDHLNWNFLCQNLLVVIHKLLLFGEARGGWLKWAARCPRWITDESSRGRHTLLRLERVVQISQIVPIIDFIKVLLATVLGVGSNRALGLSLLIISLDNDLVGHAGSSILLISLVRLLHIVHWEMSLIFNSSVMVLLIDLLLLVFQFDLRFNLIYLL